MTPAPLRPTLSVFAVLTLISMGGGCASSSVRRGEELRVSRAVLYQNGIGYFERRGRIEGDQLTLRVRPDQIRDVLKSLTVVDLSDGRAVSVALPIEKSRAKLLSDLPEQVRTQGGVLAIAQAFRGALCQVDGERSVTGRLVGVENLGGEEGKPDWRVSVLTDGGALVQLQVGKVRSLKVLDGSLELGLRKALDVALDAGAWKPVDVSVRLAGKNEHDLAVSYVVEMPAWKPAYRIVMQKEQKALLQGWAVVDNVSGDDWKDVRLSLTAGTPLAFTYDLYTPRFPQRPHLAVRDEVAQLPTDAFNAVGGIAAAPPPAPAAEPSEEAEMSIADEAGESSYGGGGGGRSAPSGSAGPSRTRKKGGARAMAEQKAMAMAPRRDSRAEPPMSREILERNFRTLVAGTSVGSLFRYDIEEPVTIAERQSALVNVVNAKVPGEDCLLFRVGSDGVNPYRAVRFANDSGLVLEAGPIAIYRSDDEAGGTFLGEALAQRIEKGANTFVPYAIDGRIRVTLDEQHIEEGVQLVKIVRGVLTIQNRQVTKFSYDVDNGSGEEATIYVRRERRAGWSLVGKEKMIEEGGAYYVPIKLAKAGRTRVTVEEESPVRRTVDIFDANGRNVAWLYLSSNKADRRVAAPLKEAIEIRDRIGAIEEQLGTLGQQREAQAQREQEVRDNLKALGKASANADLRRKLEATLLELEKGLNDVTRKLVQLNMEKGELQSRLAVLLKSITLE